MKLGIQGKIYNFDDALARPTLNDLVALKLQTGMGIRTLKESVSKLDEMGDDLEAMTEDADLLNGFRALIWLVRRFAGERLTIDEANDFPIDEMSFISEPDDEVEVDDPTISPTVSSRGDGALAVDKSEISAATITTSEPQSALT